MKQKSVQVQIAERAGVSQTLVSFVINNNKKQLARMNEQTVLRVRQAAEELGYYRNELFAAMRRGHSRFLALMACNVSHEYFARAIEEIMDATELHDYTQKLFKLNDANTVASAITRIQEYRIQGGVFFSIDSTIAKKFWSDLASPSFNALLINCDPKSISGGVPVQVDEKTTMQNAVHYLMEHGHRRIAYAGPLDTGFVHTARVNAFRSAMEEHGLTPVSIPITWDMSDRCEAIVSALKKKNRPTAFICYSDPVALIVYHAAWTIGLQVPKDLSVIGFDDNNFSPLMAPPLTTFRQDLSIIRTEYVPELIQSIETGTPMDRRKKRLISTTMIERQSVGPASAK